jgi:hypothetical protein
MVTVGLRMPRSMPLTYVRCSPASKAKSSWDHSCSFLILFTLRPTYLRISIRKASPDDDYWSTDYEDMMATKTRKKAEQRYKVGKIEPRSVDVYVGHHLRERRTIVGISRTALGETVGLSFQQIQKFEKGITGWVHPDCTSYRLGTPLSKIDTLWGNHQPWFCLECQ